MLTGNALAVERWETKTWLEAIKDTAFSHLFNRGAVYFPEELKGADFVGDSLTFAYAAKLLNVPIGEGGTAYGNEEALNLGSHNMVMNESRIPVLNPNKYTIEQQRTKVLFEDVSMDLVKERISELLDFSCFYQLAGANPTSVTLDGTTYSGDDRLHIQGHNTPVAPSTNRIIRAAAAASDQALTSSDTFNLTILDYAIELAGRTRHPLKRLKGQTFDLYISWEQYTDLKQDAGSAIQWFNIQLGHLQGGKPSKLENIFENNMVCAGVYGNVNIYVCDRVAYGVSGADSSVITTVRRAVLVGKDALAFGSPFGGRPKDNDVPVKYAEELVDYGHKKGICANLIYGVKKMQPSNGEDIGVIVISTYAATHGV